MADKKQFVVTIAQLNPVVGDVAGNAAKARAARAKAKSDGADLVVLTELFIAGYPPEDLVLKPAFQAACRAEIETLARETSDGGPAMLIGTPWVDDGKLYNACALLDGGRIAAIRYKVNLPNYGVFDEKRVFARGPVSGPVTIRGVRVGIPICEDTWMEESADYENVVECLHETGAEILIVPNGSPYTREKYDMRMSVSVARVTESHLPLIYVNEIGGQDELVFDGTSFGLNADKSLAFQLPSFAENITTTKWTKGEGGWTCKGLVASLIDGDKADYAACVLGLRDYVTKTGFPGVLLGVSGGIDSALCAAIAVDALGADKLRGVMLPFRFTAQESLDDAARRECLRWVDYAMGPFHEQVTQRIVYEKAAPKYTGAGFSRAPDMNVIRAGREELKLALKQIGAAAETNGNLACRETTLGDLAVAAHLSALDYFGEVPWTDFPAAAEWYVRMKSRPSFRSILLDRVPGQPPVSHYAELDF